MPITKELKNVKKYESAGFTHEQAETLAETIEESHVDSQESLKDFIRNELKGISNELDAKITGISNELEKQTKDFDLKLGAIDNKLSQQISDLAVNMATSQKDLLIKLFGIIVGTVGVAVTILKLF